MSSADALRAHGGPDALGAPRYDFSTNSNACGSCPQAVQGLRQADATRYPDPSYRALRERVARFHHVAPERIVLAGSASEFIFRITAVAARRGICHVRVPRHAYGDYRHAGQAWGMSVTEQPATKDTAAESAPVLSWACDPSSPLGDAQVGLADWADGSVIGRTIGVLDRAYEPLRLEGASALRSGALDAVWQLFSPNKALGLTGVRAAYAVAPAQAAPDARELEALCPSWPLGAHGVALLQAWCDPAAQAWLAGTRQTLRAWKLAQQRLCADLGWTVLPSQTNFFCAAPNCVDHELSAGLTYLRQHGIKLRDARSFGLAGYFRLAVLGPEAQKALQRAWLRWLSANRMRSEDPR